MKKNVAFALMALTLFATSGYPVQAETQTKSKNHYRRDAILKNSKQESDNTRAMPKIMADEKSEHVAELGKNGNTQLVRHGRTLTTRRLK